MDETLPNSARRGGSGSRIMAVPSADNQAHGRHLKDAWCFTRGGIARKKRRRDGGIKTFGRCGASASVNAETQGKIWYVLPMHEIDNGWSKVNEQCCRRTDYRAQVHSYTKEYYSTNDGADFPGCPINLFNNIKLRQYESPRVKRTGNDFFVYENNQEKKIEFQLNSGGKCDAECSAAMRMYACPHESATWDPSGATVEEQCGSFEYKSNPFPPDKVPGRFCESIGKFAGLYDIPPNCPLCPPGGE